MSNGGRIDARVDAFAERRALAVPEYAELRAYRVRHNNGRPGTVKLFDHRLGSDDVRRERELFEQANPWWPAYQRICGFPRDVAVAPSKVRAYLSRASAGTDQDQWWWCGTVLARQLSAGARALAAGAPPARADARWHTDLVELADLLETWDGRHGKIPPEARELLVARFRQLHGPPRRFPSGPSGLLTRARTGVAPSDLPAFDQVVAGRISRWLHTLAVEGVGPYDADDRLAEHATFDVLSAEFARHACGAAPVSDESLHLLCDVGPLLVA